MAQMSLYRYCRAADGVLDPKGPLARTIPPNVLTEVNKQVKLVAAGQMKKRGSYVVCRKPLHSLVNSEGTQLLYVRTHAKRHARADRRTVHAISSDYRWRSAAGW